MKKADVNDRRRVPIYGKGINDLPYVTERKERVNGKLKLVWRCPFYATWRNMMMRVNDINYMEKHPRYKDCEVCEDWYVFSNFKAWMETQNWAGNLLDKDLLSSDSKVYSPETCVFISPRLNSFLVVKSNSPTGAAYDKRRGHWNGMCNKGNGKSEYLGRFSTPEAAHRAWQVAKREVAIDLLKLQDNPRVLVGLCKVINKLESDIYHERITVNL